jgi:hypothetical protein
MCAEKPEDVRDGTEAFALGGFTETLSTGNARASGSAGKSAAQLC